MKTTQERIQFLKAEIDKMNRELREYETRNIMGGGNMKEYDQNEKGELYMHFHCEIPHLHYNCKTCLRTDCLEKTLLKTKNLILEIEGNKNLSPFLNI